MKIDWTTIVLSVLVLFVVALYYSIKKAFTSPKCPFCGEYMESFYNIESKKYEYQCPKCDYYMESE